MRTVCVTAIIVGLVLISWLIFRAPWHEEDRFSANQILMNLLANGDANRAIALMIPEIDNQRFARPAACVLNVNIEYIMQTANGVVLYSETPLTRACSVVSKERRKSLVECLLRAGADPNSGWPTPVACCAMDGDIETMELLYAGGANLCEDARQYAIYEAGRSKSGRLKGVDIGVGQNAMQIASGTCRSDVLKWLIEHGATCTGICGGDALIQAVKWACVDCKELLINNGAPITYTNQLNETLELTGTGLILRCEGPAMKTTN